MQFYDTHIHTHKKAYHQANNSSQLDTNVLLTHSERLLLLLLQNHESKWKRERSTKLRHNLNRNPGRELPQDLQERCGSAKLHFDRNVTQMCGSSL